MAQDLLSPWKQSLVKQRIKDEVNGATKQSSCCPVLVSLLVLGTCGGSHTLHMKMEEVRLP